MKRNDLAQRVVAIEPQEKTKDSDKCTFWLVLSILLILLAIGVVAGVSLLLLPK